MTRSNNASLSRLCSQWRGLFKQLCEYKVQFGDCLVPARYPVNPKLGKWVLKQRARYRKNTEEKNSTAMIAEDIRALNCIGFEWGTPSKTTLKSCPAPARWNERFLELKKYKEQCGDCLVPTKYCANPKLGTWVSNQRQYYKLHQEGKPSSMTEERIRALEDPRIGFKWKLK